VVSCRLPDPYLLHPYLREAVSCSRPTQLLRQRLVQTSQEALRDVTGSDVFLKVTESTPSRVQAKPGGSRRSVHPYVIG